MSDGCDSILLSKANMEMKIMNVNEIIAAIISGNLTSEDRIKINNALIYSRDSASIAKKANFKVGQAVYFTGKNGLRIDGVVTKIMQKNIGVDCGIDGRWKVGADLLTAA